MLSIGIGSKTSTGGVVIEGNDNILFNGLIASSVGQKATCPACKEGVGPIVAVGARTSILPAGPAARAGDYIACGCPPGSNVLLPAGTVTIGTGRGFSSVTAVSPSGLDTTQHAPPTPAEPQPAPNAAPTGSQFADSPNSTPHHSSADPQESSDHVHYKWALGQSDYFIRQLAFLPVEGVGVNGAFFIRGHLALHGQRLYISAMGFTAAQRMGKVHFSASVTAAVNGREVFAGPMAAGEGSSMWPDDEYSAIGSVTIELPAPEADDRLAVTIRGTYIYSAAEGRAVPMPPTGTVTFSLMSEPLPK